MKEKSLIKLKSYLTSSLSHWKFFDRKCNISFCGNVNAYNTHIQFSKFK